MEAIIAGMKTNIQLNYDLRSQNSSTTFEQKKALVSRAN